MKFEIGDRVVVDKNNPGTRFSGHISGFVSGTEDGLFVVSPDYVHCGYLYDNNNLKKGYISRIVVHQDNLIKEDLVPFT